MDVDFLQQRPKPALPAKFSYSHGGWAAYGLFLSIVLFALGGWAYLHEVLGSQGMQALTGVLVLLGCAMLMALLSTIILFAGSDITVNDDGVHWSIIGWRWRKILWTSIARIGVSSMYNAKEKNITKIYTFEVENRKFFYKPRIADDINNFYALKDVCNYFIEINQIAVKSTLKGEEGDRYGI